MPLPLRILCGGLLVSAGLLLTLSVPAFAAGADADDEAVERIVAEIRGQGKILNPQLYKRLTAIGNRSSFDAIVKICPSVPNDMARRQAYLSLTAYRGLADLEPRAVKWLAAESDGSRELNRRAAAKALARFGSSAAAELRHLVSRSKDERVRAFAVGGTLEALVREGSRNALERLLRNALIGPSGGRTELLGALQQLAEKGLDEGFAAGLKHKEVAAEIKILAMEALRGREGVEVTKALLDALKDKTPEVQVAAMLALDAAGADSHMRQLSKLLKSKHEGVRRQAIISLGRLKRTEEGWLEDLFELARDRNPATRQGAAVALAEARTPEALEALYLLLADSDHLVRREALQQVANLRRKETLPALIMRLNGEGGRLKRDILAALRLITGLDHGMAFERWNRWWKTEGADFELPTYEDALRAERRREKNASEGRTVSSFFGLKIVSDRICFVLNVSGSMSEASGKGTRMDSAKRQLVEVLRVFPTGDLFNVIFFSNDAFPWEDELVTMNKKNRKAALSYVERQRADGATAIYNALELAFEDRAIDTIYLLTDGTPSGGKVDNPEEIRAQVKSWNEHRLVRIHCIAIGATSPLLQNLAKDSGGDYKLVQ
jgi:HEAT repeat protein